MADDMIQDSGILSLGTMNIPFRLQFEFSLLQSGQHLAKRLQVVVVVSSLNQNIVHAPEEVSISL